MNEPPGREVAIFTRALELPEDRRSAYLAEACGGDDGLRSQVEGLLRAHVSAADFMETAPGDSARHGVSGIGEKVGDRIGRYHLLQQIGEGGCGVVFMAEQETPVRRMVALKVVKPGMDSKSVVARFEAERQALALMDHPNIATVLDGGSTETGRPYFVMELVRGLKITDYCDRNSLSTPERLELFIQVCHAVQHAHQKGIIHRDLKPSNILVTVDESGKPLPKVIDFGIAKAVSGLRLTDRTVFTAFEMLIGTPAYMSPEQAALTSVDVDTRSDIYSLGVLLYELLTGTTPFDTQQLLKAGLDEVRRVILHQEPVRPSTRLCTMLAADLTTVAQHRQIEAPRLIRSVRGDLDWIVIKALEKDRTRRYHTATGLAEDVRRYLADEVISARSPSLGYRFRKLVERNRVVFTAAAVVLVLLLASLVFVTRSLAKERLARREADAEKRTAQDEAAKSRQVTGFLKDMLRGVSPAVALGRDTVLLREILDQTAARLPVELTNQPAVEAELGHILGLVYEDLGAYGPAEKIFRRTLELRRAQLPDESSEVVMALNRLGLALLRQLKLEEAEQHIVKSLELNRRLRGDEDLDTVVALENLAIVRWRQNRLPEAEAMMREVYATRTRQLPPDHTDRINALNNLGNVVFGAGRFAEAEKIYREVLATKQEHLGKEHMANAVTWHNLGAALLEQGKIKESQESISKAVQLRRKLLGEDHRDSVVSLDSLGDLHRLTGNFADAETIYRQSLDLGLKRSTKSDPVTIRTVTHLVLVLGAQHKQREIDKVLNMMLTEDFVERRESLPLLNLRMEHYAKFGRWSEALKDAVRIRDFEPGEHLHYHALAPLLVATGKLEDYQALCGEILRRFGDTKDMFVADRMAKDCLIHPAAGVDLQRVATMADIPVTTGKDQPAYPFFQLCKALAEHRQGNHPVAIEWARSALAAGYPHVGVGANAVMAMSQGRMQQADAARASLALAVSTAEARLPKLESGDIGSDWRDWIIAHRLLDEAKAALDNTSGEGVDGAKR